jgi:hypothetical protein
VASIATCQLTVPPRFTRVRDVVEGLAHLEEELVAQRDRRAVFVTAYLTITRTIEAWLERGVFLQNAVVAAYAVAFANAYRHALASYEQGRPDEIPAAWRQSFDARLDARVSVVQHLLLGINAHINHDLPYAVLQGGLDVHCDRCYSDHTRINDALRVATPFVRRRITAAWPRRYHLVGYLYGPMIDEAVAMTFVRARQRSWALAKMLDTAPPAERLRLRAFIDERAARIGDRILRRPAGAPAERSAFDAESGR